MGSPSWNELIPDVIIDRPFHFGCELQGAYVLIAEHFWLSRQLRSELS
jgi:hypothetical protein